MLRGRLARWLDVWMYGSLLVHRKYVQSVLRGRLAGWLDVWVHGVPNVHRSHVDNVLRGRLADWPNVWVRGLVHVHTRLCPKCVVRSAGLLAGSLEV